MKVNACQQINDDSQNLMAYSCARGSWAVQKCRPAIQIRCDGLKQVSRKTVAFEGTSLLVFFNAPFGF